MDTSSNMDTLDDSSTLPELSFDDLLDPSPIKKNGKQAVDDDPLEYEEERKTHKDDILNTPGPKKSHMIPRTISNNSISSKAIPIRTNPIKAGNPLTTSFSKNSGGGNGGNASAPILLNTKNVLPKMATQITNNSIKITPKTVSSTAGSGGVVTATAPGVSMAGKTAVRTSTGQLIYIQKNPSTSSSSAIKTGNTINVKQQMISTGGSGGGGNKPVTIQVVRNADGNFVPVKSSAAGNNGKNTTLTLSPTTLVAGKKIVSTSGNQVLIKSATTSTNSNPAMKTVVKPAAATTTAPSGDLMVKPNAIFVQSKTGKQIIVSNPNLVKLSPKTQTTTNSASGTSTVTSAGSGTGQLHAIQIAGKQGVQYVRVMPSSKVGTKSVSVTSAGPSSSIARTMTTSASATTTVTGSAPVKILNNLPQKFTVLQKGSGAKVVVTQKKDTQNVEYSPIASKVHKTIVTMPSLRPISDEQPKLQQQTNIKDQQAPNYAANQTLMRKHKISEINSELKRITATHTEDSGGPPEIKKPAPNNRLVVISSTNAPKILNNSIQQPGRVTTSSTSSSSFTSSGAVQVQGTKYTSSSASNASSAVSTMVGNKLYTILKPSGQQNPAKLYSVLKTSGGSSMTTTTQPSFTAPAQRPLLNKQSMLQQQQKIFHLKQLQKSKLTQSSSSLNIKSSSSTFCPVKIKEEPLEFHDNSTTATEKHNSSSSFTSPSTSASANALQPLSMVSTEMKEDPNKIDLVGGVRRKHCNCSKSQCLKLYCDCFANGEFCQDCSCKDCCNNLDNEDERQRAIKSCLERNPSAFKPKITSSSDQGDMRLHNKGCNCKRSGCLKNYCECYEAKIPCSSNCKCVGCRNVEDRPDLDLDPVDPKVMASIANVSAMSTSQKRNYEKVQRDSMGNVSIKTEKIKMEAGAEANNDAPPVDKKQQCNFITQEVVDATIQCMVTQADECEKNGLPAYQMEKMVMEELGRCLVEIIDFSIRNTDTSYSQD